MTEAALKQDFLTYGLSVASSVLNGDKANRHDRLSAMTLMRSAIYNSDLVKKTSRVFRSLSREADGDLTR